MQITDLDRERVDIILSGHKQLDMEEITKEWLRSEPISVYKV